MLTGRQAREITDEANTQESLRLKVILGRIEQEALLGNYHIEIKDFGFEGSDIHPILPSQLDIMKALWNK